MSATKRSKYDIAVDVAETIHGLDGDYIGDMGLVLSVGGDPENDRRVIGQVFYDDGTEAEVEICVKVTNVQKKEIR